MKRALPHPLHIVDSWSCVVPLPWLVVAVKEREKRKETLDGDEELMHVMIPCTPHIAMGFLSSSDRLLTSSRFNLSLSGATSFEEETRQSILLCAAEA
ncbi:Os12g0165832 [Oryza sativa Japonica Group]|uniref:Os12g0165832 protein n=1 Tax=Oryza sativa subsp. japonica TaxID=39947 RepID=A0A0P0Y7F5_ORYSJ|nr:Os12g0165832 [Oryza sativa Japonica Group]